MIGWNEPFTGVEIAQVLFIGCPIGAVFVVLNDLHEANQRNRQHVAEMLAEDTPMNWRQIDQMWMFSRFSFIRCGGSMEPGPEFVHIVGPLYFERRVKA